MVKAARNVAKYKHMLHICCISVMYHLYHIWNQLNYWKLLLYLLVNHSSFFWIIFFKIWFLGLTMRILIAWYACSTSNDVMCHFRILTRAKFNSFVIILFRVGLTWFVVVETRLKLQNRQVSCSFAYLSLLLLASYITLSIDQVSLISV